MSRYFKLILAAGPGGNKETTYTSKLDSGGADLGAPRIELDIPVYDFATPSGQAFVRVWGVSLDLISQASDFAKAPVTLEVGMLDGLPLATAAAGQSGLVLQGQAFQAFGNWMGNNQTLDLVVTVDGGATQSTPVNLSFMWKKGQALSDVITSVLTTAYPDSKVDVKIKDGLVLSADEIGCYDTIQQFAAYVKQVSQQIAGGDYPGVSIVLSQGTFKVFDGSSPADPVELNFADMIGQVTWLGAFQVQFNTVMRADLSVGDVVKFPEAASLQTTTTPSSQSQARDKSTFSGSWTISYVRHVGDSRAADAMSWISTYQAYSNNATPAQLGEGATSA